MNITLFTLFLLLVGTLSSQSSHGESREKDHYRSCRSGRQDESCGTDGSMKRYKKVNQEKHVGDDEEDYEDDDEDDDDDYDDDDDDDDDHFSDQELLQRSRGGANIGDSRLAQEKLEDGASVGRSGSDGKKNTRTNLKQQKGSKYARDAYHDKSDSIKNKIKDKKQKPTKEDKENENMNTKQRPIKDDHKNKIKNDKMKPIKEDSGMHTDASVKTKDKRKDETQNNEYERKEADINSGKGSRKRREVNKLESREQLGHKTTQGEDNVEHTTDEKESTGTVSEVERNVEEVSDDVNSEKHTANTERKNDVVELDPDSEAIGDTDGSNTANSNPGQEELGNLSHGDETGAEGTNVELIREVEDTGTNEERLEEVVSTIEEDPDRIIDESDSNANEEIPYTEPTTAPRRLGRHSPFPEVTLEFDSTTMLPEHLRTGKSDDTENWEFNLSGGRKVETERTSEHNNDVASGDAGTDILEDYGNENHDQTDMTEKNSLPFESILENENAGNDGNDVEEANVSENGEREADLLMKKTQDTEEAKLSSETGSGEK